MTSLVIDLFIFNSINDWIHWTEISQRFIISCIKMFYAWKNAGLIIIYLKNVYFVLKDFFLF